MNNGAPRKIRFNKLEKLRAEKKLQTHCENNSVILPTAPLDNQKAKVVVDRLL